MWNQTKAPLLFTGGFQALTGVSGKSHVVGQMNSGISATVAESDSGEPNYHPHHLKYLISKNKCGNCRRLKFDFCCCCRSVDVQNIDMLIISYDHCTGDQVFLTTGSIKGQHKSSGLVTSESHRCDKPTGRWSITAAVNVHQ